MKNSFSLIALLILFSNAALANDQRTIRVTGRENATITTQQIKLSDIADVTGEIPKDQEAIIAIKKIVIADAPTPSKAVSIGGNDVLTKLREAGVDLNKIIYTIPRDIQVSRAHRVLSLEEIERAISAYINTTGREINIKRVNYNNDIKVAPGDVHLSVEPFNTTAAGRLGFKIDANVPDSGDNANFTVTTDIEEWREVPVAKRPLSKGTLISEEDVMMARLNVGSIPSDAAQESNSLIGLEAQKEIGYGEVFRNNKLKVKPLIETGSKVVLRYKSALLEATATGIAVEPGIKGQQIKVKNESSKKIVVGSVVEPGLVEVHP